MNKLILLSFLLSLISCSGNKEPDNPANEKSPNTSIELSEEAKEIDEITLIAERFMRSIAFKNYKVARKLSTSDSQEALGSMEAMSGLSDVVNKDSYKTSEKGLLGAKKETIFLTQKKTISIVFANCPPPKDGITTCQCHMENGSITDLEMKKEDDKWLASIKKN